MNKMFKVEVNDWQIFWLAGRCWVWQTRSCGPFESLEQADRAIAVLKSNDALVEESRRDMLAALEICRELFDGGLVEGIGFEGTLANRACDAIDAAIAKAKGEA